MSTLSPFTELLSEVCLLSMHMILHLYSIQAVRFDECSNGKLQMIPAVGTGVTNGVTTVRIDGDLSTKDHFYCMEKARIAVATTIIRDFTMIICPNVIDFDGAAAYASKPGSNSWYLSKYASIPMVQFHEISHNFGLGEYKI